MLQILVLAAVACAQAGTSPRMHTLDNGLTVLLREDHERPLVALCVYVNGGGRTESDEIKGLSHYYEHTIFRGGTDRQKEEETRRKFQLLGEYSGYTTDDATAYYFRVPKHNLDEALWRFADALMNLQVTEEKIERDRQSIVQELHMRVSDAPSGRAYLLLTGAAFRKHPYRIGPIGTEQVVSTAKIERFKSFYQERYVPNQMVLAAVGDFTAEEMLRKIQAQFSKYARGRSSFELGVAEPAQEDVRETVEARESALSYLMVGFKAESGTHPDSPALSVIDALLTAGPGSRLRQALVERQSICSTVWSAAPLMRDPYLFTVGLEMKPENEERAVTTLLSELSKLREEAVSADELSRVRGEIERDHLVSQESYAAQAQTMCRFGLLGRPEESEHRLTRELRVSSEELMAVARRIFVSDGCTLALVRPPGGTAPSYAARVSAALPKGAAARAAAAAPPKMYRLRDKKYGFMQIVKEDRAWPVFSAAAVVRGGPLLDAPEKPGAAHLLGKMVRKGTAELSASQVAGRLASLGLSLDASTEPDHLRFTMSGPARNVKDGVSLLLALLSAPALRADEVETARAEALAEIAALEDDSYALAEREFAAALFAGSAAARHPYGDKASVSALTAADLAAYHRAAFVPRNVYVAVVGDVAGSDVTKLLDAAAAQLPAGKELPVVARSPAKTPPSPLTREVARTTRQVALQLGWPGVPVDHADHLALRVGARILGLRLFFRYVYQDGIAYRMWTRAPARMGAAPFFFQLGVAPENFEKSKAGLLSATRELIAELAGPGTMKSELEDVRRDLIQGFQLSMETARGQAVTYAYHEACQLGAEFVDQYADRVNAVKRGAISEAMKRYLDPERYVAVVVRKSK